MPDRQPPARRPPASKTEARFGRTRSEPELELTLTADPGRLEAAWNSPALRRKVGREALQRLKTIYYDTADLRLRRHGLALRVREEDGRFVQTLKIEEGGLAGVSRRREVSSPVRSARPDLRRLKDALLRKRVGLVASAQLEPIFTTRVERRRKKVHGDGKVLVDVALDHGEGNAKDLTWPIAELELELVEGSSDALYGLAGELNEQTPLALETISKAERGYAAASGEALPWVQAEEPVFQGGVSLDRAIDMILRACVGHWLANYAAVLEGSDPEGVHQLRIALRRLRSALAVFKAVLPPTDAAWLDGEASWLIQSLAAARDWDVFLTELLPPLHAVRRGNGDLAALEAAAQDARCVGYERARSALRSARHTAFVLDLGRWIEREGWRGTDADERLDQPLADYACSLLRKRYKRVLKRGRDFGTLSDEERHRLRITLKKLRYTAEFFASLYPRRKAKPYLKALKRLQDELGHLNDVVVAEGLLNGLLGSAEGSNTAALRSAAAMVVGWYSHALVAARPGTELRWRDFAASRPFWSAS